MTDGKSRTYVYNEAIQLKDSAGTQCASPFAAGNGFGHLLYSMTGLIDENNRRHISWTYDCLGKATSSELADGQSKVAIAYDLPASGKRTLTHYLGTANSPVVTQSVLSYEYVQTVPLRTATANPCVECGAVISRVYDANGNTKSATDWSGAVTDYTYDLLRNLETSRTEAVGTPQVRKVSTEWHPRYRLPVRIAEANRLTVLSYDLAGNLQSKSVRATTDATGASGFAATMVGAARVWSYTYNAAGQVRTATAPRTDVVSTTTYDYDSQGNLIAVTNAAGHQTLLANYDADGRAGRITEPNGLVTDLFYSPRGWLTSSVSGGQTTTYEHDGVGQLRLLTQPDGTKISYTYDDAHRLTGIADNLGNSVTYTLDLTGNRVAEQVRDPAGTLARQTSRVYDLLNRVTQVTGAQQ